MLPLLRPEADMRELEAFLERLRAVLEPRVGRNQAKSVLANLWRMKEGGASEPGILEAAHRTYDAFARTPVSCSPFGPGLSKAIAEAAPRKLQSVGPRLRVGRPVRGLDEDEARALAQHADLLTRSFGEGDEAFAIGVAWRSALLYRNALVLGEARGRNDSWPLDALEDAWRRQGELEGAAPVLVVPEHGVVYATGPVPSAHVLERWVPHGFLFIPDEAGGRRLHLEREDELKAFLARVRPPVTAATAPALLHLLLAPFPWKATVQMDLGALAQLEDEEARLEEQSGASRTVSLLLGVPPRSFAPALEALSFTVQPDGTSVRYTEAGGLELR